MREHLIIPDIVEGYELNQERGEGYWSIITPEPTRNLVVNPSFEHDEFGWNLGPTPFIAFSRSDDISIFGAYSVKMVGKDVVLPQYSYIYTTLTEWDHEQPLVFSAYGITLMYAINSRALRVGIALKQGDNVIIETMSQPLKNRGRWFRVWASLDIPYYFRADAPDKSIELRLYHGGGKGEVVYWDAVQAEQKPMPTTYCEGDMVGLPDELKAYCWEGSPHRSVSTRSGLTRSGGYPVNFSQHGFKLTEFQNIGLAPVESQTQAYGLLPGSVYSQSRFNEREMILSGRVCADQYPNLRQRLFAVEKLLAPSVATRAGLFKLLFSQSDCCDDTLEIYAAYNGGMEGDYTSLYQSEFVMRALAPDPFFKTIGERGQRLNYAQQLAVRNIIQRKGNGEWDNLRGGVRNSGGVSGIEEVLKILWIDSKIVAFGNFDRAAIPELDLSVTLNKLAQYSDDDGWVDIFAGDTYLDLSDLEVKDIIRLPDGRLVFTAYDTGLLATAVYGVNLTSLNDCQTTVNLLGSLWTTNPPGTWLTLAVDKQGFIYAGGTRGDIEVYDRQAWSVFKTGFKGTIHDMAFDVDGYLYVVGDFSLEVTVPVEAMPTYTLKVLPKWKAVKTYELKAVPAQVVQHDATLVAVADVTNDTDDAIATYDWLLAEDNSGTPNPTTDLLCKFTLIGGDTNLSTIQLTVTTASGKELTNQIVYYCNDSGGDPSWTAVAKMATDNTLTYNLDMIKFSPDVVLHEETDPIIQYFWSNDQTADTSTDKEPTFDFSTLNVDDEVVITLVTTTQYGGVNTNTITLTKDADKGMIEVADSATTDETVYVKTVPGQPTNVIVTCHNGVMIAPDLTTICMGDLPPSYCVSIGEDKRAYIGALNGLYSYNGESIQRLAATSKITSLAIHPLTGEVYVGGAFGVKKWNFYYLVSAGITLNPNAVVNGLSFNDCDGALAIALRYTGGVRVSGHVSAYYPGSAEVRPSFRFFGPGNLIEITNYTTHQSLYPQHTMQAGEIVDFSLEHGRVSFRSSYWGELPIPSGTNSNFFLAKEYNDFGLWIDNGATYCTEAVAIFPVKHISANALCAPGADVRFPVDPLPEPCCIDGRLFVIGADAPTNECYKSLGGAGSIIFDMVTRQEWINVACDASCNEVAPVCEDCSPGIHIDDSPTPDVSYNCIPGTVVINPITHQEFILIDCNANLLTDTTGVILTDTTGECLTDTQG